MAYPRRFPRATDASPTIPQVITLIGTLPAYTAPPLSGQDVDTNFVPSDTGDFASSAGTITTVQNQIRVQTSPDAFNDYDYLNGFLDPVQPGDQLSPIAVVTDSAANVRSFLGSVQGIALPAPTITSQPVLPAVLVAGMTTFNVDFGAAGPVGTSGFLGDYSPTLTRTFTINGVNRVSELTQVSGANYTWTGAPLPVNAVVSVRASWTNATGTIQSSIVSRTAAALFQLSRDDLTYEAVMANASGIVTGNVTSPAPYATYAGPAGAGTFAIDSSLHATGPVVMFPPVVADVAGTFTLTQAAVWTRANGTTGFTQGGQWYRDGVAVSGQTSPTYSGAAPVTSIEWRATASDSNGSRVSASNVIGVGAVKTRALIWSGANAVGGSSQTYSPDLSGATAGDILIIGLSVHSNQSAQGTVSGTLGATSLGTALASTDTALSAIKMYYFRVVHPGGTPTLTLNAASMNFNRSHVVIEKVTNASATAITTAKFERQAAASPGSLDLNVASGNLLFAIVGGTATNGVTHDTSGAGTAIYSNTIPTNALKTSAYALLADSTEVPRDVNTTWTGNATIAGLAITL